MWEGQALPHDTKFGNSRCEIVGRRVIFIWSLIHGLRWSGLIKAEPDYRLHVFNALFIYTPDSQVHVANMGPTWGRSDPVGPHMGHVNLAIGDTRHPQTNLVTTTVMI